MQQLLGFLQAMNSRLVGLSDIPYVSILYIQSILLSSFVLAPCGFVLESYNVEKMHHIMYTKHGIKKCKKKLQVQKYSTEKKHTRIMQLQKTLVAFFLHFTSSYLHCLHLFFQNHCCLVGPWSDLHFCSLFFFIVVSFVLFFKPMFLHRFSDIMFLQLVPGLI